MTHIVVVVVLMCPDSLRWKSKRSSAPTPSSSTWVRFVTFAFRRAKRGHQRVQKTAQELVKQGDLDGSYVTLERKPKIYKIKGWSMLWSAIYHETGYTVQVYTCIVYPVVYTFSWSSKYKLSWYIPVLSLYVTDQLTYKFILIRNKYILVPYILSHDK